MLNEEKKIGYLKLLFYKNSDLIFYVWCVDVVMGWYFLDIFKDKNVV